MKAFICIFTVLFALLYAETAMAGTKCPTVNANNLMTIITTYPQYNNQPASATTIGVWYVVDHDIPANTSVGDITSVSLPKQKTDTNSITCKYSIKIRLNDHELMLGQRTS